LSLIALPDWGLLAARAVVESKVEQSAKVKKRILTSFLKRGVAATDFSGINLLKVLQR
jgi:hypothetical protein